MPPEQLARGAAKQEVSKPSPTAVAAARGGKRKRSRSNLEDIDRLIQKDDEEMARLRLPCSLAHPLSAHGITWKSPLGVEGLQDAITAGQAAALPDRKATKGSLLDSAFIPQRTRDVTPTLKQDICLECSKYLDRGDEPDEYTCVPGFTRLTEADEGFGLACERNNKYDKCYYCAKKGIKCEPVSEEFHARVNYLIGLRRALPSLPENLRRRRQSGLKTEVMYYKQDLEAWKMTEDRKGRSVEYLSVQEYAKLQLESSLRMEEQLQTIADCCRAAFKLPPADATTTK